LVADVTGLQLTVGAGCLFTRLPSVWLHVILRCYVWFTRFTHAFTHTRFTHVCCVYLWLRIRTLHGSHVTHTTCTLLFTHRYGCTRAHTHTHIRTAHVYLVTLDSWLPLHCAFLPAVYTVHTAAHTLPLHGCRADTHGYALPPRYAVRTLGYTDCRTTLPALYTLHYYACTPHTRFPHTGSPDPLDLLYTHLDTFDFG